MKLCGFELGLQRPLFLIAGPCVIESEQLQMDTAGTLQEITASLGMPFIFKSSFDKANRSSGSTFRGPGIERGLEILAKVKRELKLPVLTDIIRQSRLHRSPRSSMSCRHRRSCVDKPTSSAPSRSQACR